MRKKTEEFISEAAEGVTLSGVQTNTKLHEDITLEIPATEQEPKGQKRKRCNLSGQRTEPIREEISRCRFCPFVFSEPAFFVPIGTDA